MFPTYHGHSSINMGTSVAKVANINFETGIVTLQGGQEYPIDRITILEAATVRANKGYRGLQETQTTIINGDQLLANGILYTASIRDEEFFLTGGVFGEEGVDMYQALGTIIPDNVEIELVGNIYIAPLSTKREEAYETSFFAGLSENDKLLYSKE